MTAVTVHDTDAGIGRAFVIGSMIGFVLTFIVCGAIALVCGLGTGPALGIAFFTAAWGGPGFGGMLGAVTRYNRNEAA